MDVELLQLNDSENFDSLKRYVDTLDSSYISSELPKILWKNEGAVAVQTLLTGLANSRSSQEKKFQIAETILFEVEKKQLPARVSEKLVNVLAGEVDSFPVPQLLRLVDVCCDMIRNPNAETKFACWKELLPKLVHLIVSKPSVEHGGSQMTGEKFKANVITSLCMADWAQAVVVDITAMFIDMPLSKEERSRVVRKLCSVLPSLPADQVPPFVHQMLSLTTGEHSMALFIALAAYFNTNLYEHIQPNGTVANPSLNSVMRNLKDVSAAEGTVLYHAVNHGPSGLKEMLKALRNSFSAPHLPLQPFQVTLLLALSAVSAHCEDEVMTSLRTLLGRALQEADRLPDSAWLRNVCPPPLDVTRLIGQVLENCHRGRDAVLKGLISLGFSLLGAGRGGDALHSVGTLILEDLVKRNRLVTTVILDTLSNLISQTDCSQYTDCLLVLARKQPLSVMECTGEVLKLLDSCSRLHPNTSTYVLSALLPLARLSHTVRDNLVIVLRTTLFHNDIERRVMIVEGFLELLRDLKIANMQNLSQSMSQNYCNFSQLCSQSMAGGASLSNEGLCLEVLAVLREVFKHQHQVKTKLYRGLYSSVRANPVLAPYALDYLQTHMEKWYLPGDVTPPLSFHYAVTIQGDDALLEEPLGDLVLCLALLVAKLEDAGRSAKLQDMLDSLCQRMATATINHFQLELDDGKNILEPSPEGAKKQEMLRQVLGVYEALMGYLLCSWNKGTTDKPTLFWGLFKGYTCLSDYARGLGKTDKKKGERGHKDAKTSAFRFPNTVLNLKCCARLLAIIHNVPVAWADEETTVQLRGKRELHRYAVNVAEQVINSAKAVTPAQLARDCHNLGYLCNIGRTLYSGCVTKVVERKAFDLPATLHGLQAFSNLLALVSSHFKSKINNFLSEIAGEPIGSQNGGSVLLVVDLLLEQLRDVLQEESPEEETKEEQQVKKIPVLYLAIISNLVNQLPPATPSTLQVYEKVKSMCREMKVERPGEAKALLSLLLSLHRRCVEPTSCTSPSSLQLDLALCLCNAMNLIDDEMEVEEHVDYKAVNTRTANVCIVAVCDTLQLHLVDIEWTVNRLKAEALWLAFPTPESLPQRKEELRLREMDLCQHTNNLLRVLSALCTIAVPPGIYADSVLKTLEMAYAKLTLLTKYFILKVTKFEENLPATKFDKTVRLVDSELTKNMYCFTEHVIADGTGDARGVKPSLLKQRALKETKLIPRVVLEKEQFHKFLLLLSKRAKIDLAARTKYAMMRDYRLYGRQVKQLLENERAETDAMEVEESTEEVAASAPASSPVPPKRRRSNVIADNNSDQDSSDSEDEV